MNKISILIIGGTEAYSLEKNDLGNVLDEVVINTPFGSSAKITIIDIKGILVGFLSRHGEKRNSLSAHFINIKANIFAGKELGAQRIIACHAVGAINSILEPGDIVIPDDYIDATKNRDYTFYNNKGYGFIRQTPAFCPELRRELITQARKLEDRAFDVGVYLCTEGPRLETTAEINMYKMWGGDIVGMTLIPEVYLAKELEMCYVPICYISNFAESIPKVQSASSGIFSEMFPETFSKRLKASTKLLPKIIRNVIEQIPAERNCACATTMEIYKQRGDIGEDWHIWVQP